MRASWSASARAGAHGSTGRQILTAEEEPEHLASLPNQTDSQALLPQFGVAAAPALQGGCLKEAAPGGQADQIHRANILSYPAH